jgi:hypothetical protein
VGWGLRVTAPAHASRLLTQQNSPRGHWPLLGGLSAVL